MAEGRRKKRRRRSKGSIPEGEASKDSFPAGSSGQTPEDIRRERRLGRDLRTHSSADNIENRMCATTIIATGTEVHDAVNGILIDKSAFHAPITSKTTSKAENDYQSVKTMNQHSNHITTHDPKSNIEVAERGSFHKKPGQRSRSDNQTTTFLKKENVSSTDDCKSNQTRGAKHNEVSVACEKNSSALTFKHQHEKKRCNFNWKTVVPSKDKVGASHNHESNDTHEVLSTSNENFPGKNDGDSMKVSSVTPEIDLDLIVQKPAIKVKCRHMKKRKDKMLVSSYESGNTPGVLSTSNEIFPEKVDINNAKVSSTTPEIDLDLDVPKPVVKVKRRNRKKKKSKILVTDCESGNSPVVISTSNGIFPGKDDINNVKVSSTTPEIVLDLDVPKPAVKVKCRKKKKKKDKMLVTNYESSNTPVILSTSNEIFPGENDINNVKVEKKDKMLITNYESSNTPVILSTSNEIFPVENDINNVKVEKKDKMLVTNYESSNTPVILSTSNEIFPVENDINNVKVCSSTTPEIDLDLDVQKPAVKAKHKHRKRKKNKMSDCGSTAPSAFIQRDTAEKDLSLWNSDVDSTMKIHDKGVHNCLELSAQEVNDTPEDVFSNKSEMPIEINLLPVVASSNIIKDQSNILPSLTPDIQRTVLNCPKKKLLVLDLNGLLADINSDYRVKADKKIGGKAVFKRPFCDEFLKFSFERFNIGVWSSRQRRNVDAVVDYVMGNFKHKLLFCWDQSKCTNTGHKTLENRHKPLVLKELKKLWNKEDDDLPWEKGEYQPSNTLLVDDSPYKAICNPPHTAIFPFPYDFRKKDDDSLGPQGDLRCYLEGLAMADDVQVYVRDHPFGQNAISDTGPSWKFYLGIIDKIKNREVHCSS